MNSSWCWLCPFVQFILLFIIASQFPGRSSNWRIDRFAIRFSCVRFVIKKRFLMSRLTERYEVVTAFVLVHLYNTIMLYVVWWHNPIAIPGPANCCPRLYPLPLQLVWLPKTNKTKAKQKSHLFLNHDPSRWVEAWCNYYYVYVLVAG